jgi:hypothetical protein
VRFRFGKSLVLQCSRRCGTAFAFLAQVSFVASVSFAYAQVMWRALKSRAFSIEQIDAAFSAQGSLISFLNLKMVWKMKVGTFVALIAW